MLPVVNYLNKHANAKNALYVKCWKILEKDPETKSYLEKALEYLGKSARKKYQSITENEPYLMGKKRLKDELKELTQEQMLFSSVLEVTEELFPKSLKESFIKAVKGEKTVNSVPKAVVADLIDEYRKQDKSRKDIKIRKYQKEKELEYGTKYDIPSDVESIELLSDIPKLRDIEKASDHNRWIATLEDPIDQAIARLKCVKEPKITIRELAERLSIPRSTLHDRLKKTKRIKTPCLST